jgi:hypothetical protein
MRYKRKLKVEPTLVGPNVHEESSRMAAAAAQVLMAHAQFHLGEAERFQHAAHILRGDTPGEFADEALNYPLTRDEVLKEKMEKREKWRTAKQRERAQMQNAPKLWKRKRKGKAMGNGPRSYWAAMTPAERSREMKRRQKVARGLLPKSPRKSQAVVQMPMGGVA